MLPSVHSMAIALRNLQNIWLSGEDEYNIKPVHFLAEIGVGNVLSKSYPLVIYYR